MKNRVDNVDKYVDKRGNVEITGQKLRLPAKAAGGFFFCLTGEIIFDKI